MACTPKPVRRRRKRTAARIRRGDLSVITRVTEALPGVARDMERLGAAFRMFAQAAAQVRISDEERSKWGLAPLPKEGPNDDV